MCGMSAHTSPVPSSAAINLRRLVVLRAIALGGQALAVWVAVDTLHMALPLRPLVLILAAMAVVNLFTWLRLRRPWPIRDAELFAQLALDVLVLTALLYYTGGSTNPFAPLYLLPLTLTAAALTRTYTWAMAGLTVACYSALLFVYVPLPGTHAVHGEEFQLHVVGMWLGFLLSAGLIAWFAVKMAATLRSRDRLVSAMREQELTHERVLALGTLATGAAHELGTPLSTMAVLVKDLTPGKAVAAETLSILRNQIARCKEILSSLSAAAGQVRAEAGSSRPLDAWLEELMQRWQSLRPGRAGAHAFRRHAAGAAHCRRADARAGDHQYPQQRRRRLARCGGGQRALDRGGTRARNRRPRFRAGAGNHESCRRAVPEHERGRPWGSACFWPTPLSTVSAVRCGCWRARAAARSAA